MDHGLKHKTIKLLEKRKMRSFLGRRFRQRLLKYDTKSIKHKRKIDNIKSHGN